MLGKFVPGFSSLINCMSIGGARRLTLALLFWTKKEEITEGRKAGKIRLRKGK